MLAAKEPFEANGWGVIHGVVLVGLNPSTDLPGNFSNFHSTEARHQDTWLRVFVEEAGLDGAYMTDLAERVEPRAMNVDIRDASIAGLAEQLRRLGETEYVVIAFGRDAFRALQSVGPTGYEERDGGILVSDLTLVGIPIALYGVYHYSRLYPDNVRRLRDRLGHLGREVLGS